MVMETPSPQCVGHEFVRQYYTMLHEDPLHLHRFYSHNSSFVHGGIDPEGKDTQPVMGQVEIHKKIMSLNFRNCHAKIRQVDSHATLGNGVVVQVTGELSNNGETMRRFMQTFVLAPQSPKKYYVHNDIFRYQDEVFADDTDTENQEGAVDSEAEDERTEEPISPDDIQDQSVNYYEQDVVVVSNGIGHSEEQSPPTPAAAHNVVNEVEKLEPIETELVYEEKVDVKSPEPATEVSIEPSGPKTFANVVSKSTPPSSIPGMGSNSMVKNLGNIPGPNPVFSKADNMRIDSGLPGTQPPAPQRIARQSRDRLNSRSNRSASGSGRGGDGDIGENETRRMTSRYPDNHQVFVGNLPHSISEDELKEHFSIYGNVLNLRINTKSGGGKVPNFGFIVFEDAASVQKVLSEKRTMFRGEHRLNVEEKKARGSRDTRSGSGSGDGRPGSGRIGGMGRGGMGGGGRGGGRGGGNINRTDNRGGGGGNRGFISRR